MHTKHVTGVRCGVWANILTFIIKQILPKMAKLWVLKVQIFGELVECAKLSTKGKYPKDPTPEGGEDLNYVPI